MRKWILLSCVVLAGACTAIRPTVREPLLSVPSPGRYPITVERGKWAGLNGLPLAVFVDGKNEATVGGGQAVTIYMPEGRYTIGVGAHGNSPSKAMPDSEIVVDVSAQSKPILHANVSALGYGGWKIERVAQ